MRYEDLVADPINVLRDLYAKLDLGAFADAEPGVTAYLAEEKDYKTNRFELPEEVRERISNRWSSYAKRWGYA
jgi:hypothetical protein